MSFIRMIIGLPLIVVVAVFAFINNDMANFSLWPFDVELTASLSVAVIFFIVLLSASWIPGFRTRRSDARCAASRNKTEN